MILRVILCTQRKMSIKGIISAICKYLFAFYAIASTPCNVIPHFQKVTQRKIRGGCRMARDALLTEKSIYVGEKR